MISSPTRPRNTTSRYLIWIACAVCWPCIAGAQPSAQVTFTAKPPKIDGNLDEPAWAKARVYGNFIERKPKLKAQPPERTTFRVLASSDALYFGIVCYDSRPHTIRALTKARDNFAMFRDDAISIKLDPAHDHRTTLGFVVTPANAWMDYRGINESQFRVEFDAVWRVKAKRFAGGWRAEFRIPYAAMGLDPANLPQRIGLNFSRDHARRNATYDWTLMPPAFSPIAASRYGHLTGLAALSRKHKFRSAPWYKRLVLIPYAIGGFEEADQQNIDGRFDAGADARINLRDKLQAQLTVNTDFAQIDLDDQVVNLTRFALFFPEKRDFFLRDFEIFDFGRAEQAQLFYSRRIGLRGGAPIPILEGVKMVAQAARGLRVGLVQAITRPQGDQPWAMQLVGRGLYELGGGSNVGVMLTHRQSFNAPDNRNTVIAADGTWRGLRSKLVLSAFALLSLTGEGAGVPEPAAGTRIEAEADPDKAAPGLGVDLMWRGLLWRPRLRYAYYDPQLRADLGFFQRVGIHRGSAELTLEPRIQRAHLEKLTLTSFANLVADGLGGDLLDLGGGGDASLIWDLGFFIALRGEFIRETVQSDFGVGRNTVIAAREYDMIRGQIRAGTPSVWPLSLTASAEYRGFYGGRLLAWRGELTMRPSSLVRLVLDASWSQARFDDAQRNFHTAVINARVALTLTPTLILDNYVGWNDLQQFVRIQARLRFTYAPGSNLFVVYQRDRDLARGVRRFHSLLVKLSYRY